MSDTFLVTVDDRLSAADQIALVTKYRIPDELVPFIDWSPFFHTWELRGRYPSILTDEKVG